MFISLHSLKIKNKDLYNTAFSERPGLSVLLLFPKEPTNNKM